MIIKSEILSVLIHCLMLSTGYSSKVGELVASFPGHVGGVGSGLRMRLQQ